MAYAPALCCTVYLEGWNRASPSPWPWRAKDLRAVFPAARPRLHRHLVEDLTAMSHYITNLSPLFSSSKAQTSSRKSNGCKTKSFRSSRRLHIGLSKICSL